MLDQAITALKAGKPADHVPLILHSEINVPFAALIPDDYIVDIHTRLLLYKRLASAQNLEKIEALSDELCDRFGPLPEPTRHLLALGQLRLQCQTLGIAKIDCSRRGA